MPTVPDVTGSRLAAAFSELAEAGFQPVLIGLPTAKTNGEDGGYWVTAQEPAGGSVADVGARVALAAELRVSWGTLSGPPVAAPGTPVPEVVGRALDEALSSVTAAGLIAVVFQPQRGVETLVVSRQEPEPGLPVGCFREVAMWLDQ